jgi:hypothetical protein
MNTALDFATALMKVAPNKEWAIEQIPTNQKELDEMLKWISEGNPPTFAEIKAAWEEICSAKESAQTKLAELGLTVDDLKALGL